MSRFHYEKLDGVLDEEFVLVDNPEEARFIENRLNTGEASRRKRLRMNHVREKGEVNEVLMPDTFTELVATAQLQSERIQREGAELSRLAEAYKANYPFGTIA